MTLDNGRTLEGLVKIVREENDLIATCIGVLENVAKFTFGVIYGWGITTQGSLP